MQHLLLAHFEYTRVLQKRHAAGMLQCTAYQGQGPDWSGVFMGLEQVRTAGSRDHGKSTFATGCGSGWCKHADGGTAGVGDGSCAVSSWRSGANRLSTVAGLITLGHAV